MLDGYPDRTLEGHRILDVEPVEAHLAAPTVPAAQGDAVVGSRVLLLGAPGGVEVVLGAVQRRRPPRAVDEYHVTDALGITSDELKQRAKSLKGATMPNGQKYEDWLKSKGRGEDGENNGPS
jgi:hypothetical protein